MQIARRNALGQLNLQQSAKQTIVWLLFTLLPFISMVLGLFPATVEEPGPSLTATTNVRDMSGRDVSFDHPPQNVVIFGPFLAAFATIDATMQHISAMPDFVKVRAKSGLFGHVFQQIELIPSMEGTVRPDVEWILRRRPDAVIAWKSESETLEKAGVRGLAEMDGDAISDYRNARATMWRLIGGIVGKYGRAQELLNRFRLVIEELQDQLFKVKDEPARVIMPFRMGDGIWSVADKRYYLNETLEASGGVNVARDVLFNGNTDFEQIYRLDPEVIILPYYDGGPIPQTLYSDRFWRPIRAVRDHRVYLTPVHFSDNIAVDEPLLLTWLAEIFHPNSMPHMTRAAYWQAYAQVYHYDLTDDEIDHALFFEENGASAGYERFKAL